MSCMPIYLCILHIATVMSSLGQEGKSVFDLLAVRLARSLALLHCFKMTLLMSRSAGLLSCGRSVFLITLQHTLFEGSYVTVTMCAASD